MPSILSNYCSHHQETMKLLFRPFKFARPRDDHFQRLPTKEDPKESDENEKPESESGGHPLTLIILLLTLTCCLTWVGALYFASELHKENGLEKAILVEEVIKEGGQCQSLPDVLRFES